MKPRLNPTQHERRMENRDEHEPFGAAYPAALSEERGLVTDMIEHQTAQYAVERAIRKWQPSRQIVKE